MAFRALSTLDDVFGFWGGLKTKGRYVLVLKCCQETKVRKLNSTTDMFNIVLFSLVADVEVFLCRKKIGFPFSHSPGF